MVEMSLKDITIELRDSGLSGNFNQLETSSKKKINIQYLPLDTYELNCTYGTGLCSGRK